ncbi:MAG: TetR/AcrR family transcriptional regulator [Paludibacteraceae bacterium]|nr:TetR/AcrR family transcriptional regulator [Paludibacteraceae bacterium]
MCIAGNSGRAMEEIIIKKAGEMFLKYGLRSVSIDDICNDLHISKRTFYRYFKQKEELVEKMLVRVVEKHRKVKMEYGEGETVVDYINSNFKKFAERSAIAEKHMVFFYDLEKYYPVTAGNFARQMKETDRQQVKAVLERGIEEGVFEKEMDVEAMTTLLTEGFATAFRKIEGTYAQKMEFVLKSALKLIIKQ